VAVAVYNQAASVECFDIGVVLQRLCVLHGRLLNLFGSAVAGKRWFRRPVSGKGKAIKPPVRFGRAAFSLLLYFTQTQKDTAPWCDTNKNKQQSEFA